MRESIKEFVKIVTETLPILEPIYEFGSLQVAGQEGFADLAIVKTVIIEIVFGSGDKK